MGDLLLVIFFMHIYLSSILCGLFLTFFQFHLCFFGRFSHCFFSLFCCNPGTFLCCFRCLCNCSCCLGSCLSCLSRHDTHSLCRLSCSPCSLDNRSSRVTNNNTLVQ